MSRKNSREWRGSVYFFLLIKWLTYVIDEIYEKYDCTKPFNTWRSIFIKKKIRKYYDIGVATYDSINNVHFYAIRK